MAGSRHSTPLTCPLSTFEARVQWAIKKRELYMYDDTVELNVNLPKIAVDDDDDDIEDLQRKYERRYRLKKEEKVREDEENKKKEKERMLRELLRKFPDVKLQTTNVNGEGSSLNTGQPQLKRRHDVDIPVRPMKVLKLASGNKYDVPCERCSQKQIICHEQNPAKVCCYECRKAKSGCSFVQTAKGVPRGQNRKKTPLLSSSSSEEDDYLSTAGFRRSARNLDSAYSSADISKLVTAIDAMNTTIRDGFENLQKTLEKLGDDSNLVAYQSFPNHVKRQKTPGSSPTF